MSTCCQYNLEIAGIPIRMRTELSLPWEKAFLPFRSSNAAPPQYTAVYRQVERLPAIPDKILWAGSCERAHPDGKGSYIRSFFDPTRDMEPYAVGTYDYPHGEITIDYLEHGRIYVSEMSNSFFHLGIEALLLQEQKFCFHSACVETPVGGLLFSGPSGIGKSTQADLWCNCRNASMINGDRPIIGKSGNQWLAWGSPYAGSSHYYVNRSCPIAAVIMLKQAPQCSLRHLPLSEGFRRIYSGLTIYSWNAAFAGAAFDFAVEFASEIPVYVFSCTPDEEAVDFLETELREDLGL